MKNTDTKHHSGTVLDRPSLTFLLAGERSIHRLGYGTMQLTGTGVWGDPPDRALAKTILKSAVESGVDFIDTADA
jgi:pyridoxine 4-dehydrogenase